MAFLDIYPKSKGHTLIIPKKHFRWVHDVEPFGEYWQVARKIARAQEKGLSAKWTQYFTHGLIPHAHIHMKPRYEDVQGASMLPDEHLSFSKEEFEVIAAKIRKAF